MSNPLTLLKASSTISSVSSEPPQEEQPHLPFALEIFREMMNDPEHLCCPLSLTLFEEPVIDGVGHTYEKRYIKEHFETQKKKQAVLTSPLSGEVVEDDRVVLNRSKKSELEEYKIQKANKCFDLAQQCIQRQCGDTALILINRVRQLNPKKEGLEKIEAVAQETFISISRKRTAFRVRAEALLQDKRAKQALRLLKQLEEKPVYEFSTSNEVELPIFKSNFVALSADCRYLITKSKVGCEVWDIEKTPHVVFQDLPANIENFIGTTKEIATFIYDKKLFHYHFGAKKLDRFDSCETFQISNGLDLPSSGGIFDISGGLFDIIDGSPKFEKVEHNINNSKRFFWGWMRSETVGIMVTQPVSRRKYYNRTGFREEGKFNRIALVSLSGNVKVIRGDEDGFSCDKFGGQIITDEMQVELHLVEMNITTSCDTWNRKWQSFGSDHPAADLYPPYGKMAGVYRKRMVARMERTHPLNDKIQDERFLTYKIDYTCKDTGDIEFYQTLLKAAVLGNDFESYLNAMEYLLGFHQKNRSWRALEELMLNLSGHSVPIRKKIVQAIKEADTSDDNFWTSRLHLLLGLFEKPLPLKKDAYKRALHLNPDDPAAASALEFVKALKLDQALLPETVDTSEVQELKAKIQKQQEQIDKLQELVDKLLSKK